MVRSLLSYWGGLFSGAMLVAGRVTRLVTNKTDGEFLTKSTWKLENFENRPDLVSQIIDGWPSKNNGTPNRMVKIMENPIKMG